MDTCRATGLPPFDATMSRPPLLLPPSLVYQRARKLIFDDNRSRRRRRFLSLGKRKEREREKEGIVDGFSKSDSAVVNFIPRGIAGRTDGEIERRKYSLSYLAGTWKTRLSAQSPYSYSNT